MSSTSVLLPPPASTALYYRFCSNKQQPWQAAQQQPWRAAQPQLSACMSRPRRTLEPAFLPRPHASRRLFPGPRISAAQTRGLSLARRLPATPVHNWFGMCSGCRVMWRSHHCASPRRCTLQPATPQHGLRRVRQRRAPRRGARGAEPANCVSKCIASRSL